MICNYCHREEFEIIAEQARFERHNVLRCRNCGLVFLETKAEKNEVESFYARSEYRQTPALPLQSAEEHFYDRITRNDVAHRMQFISSHMAVPGKRVLEVGSASGAFLQELLEHGAKEATGIELDEEYSRYARERGLKVITRSIEELNLKEEFDAVVSFHTLEHVYDPMAIIRAVYTALKAGAIFLGEVPNQNDWRIQIFNDEVVKRFHYDPTHLFYYSPATLTNYLKTGGFNDVSLETVERYNSLLQLRNILCGWGAGEEEEILKKYIFPRNERDETRLADTDNRVESQFNRIFEKALNSELMGNCLRWVARKT